MQALEGCSVRCEYHNQTMTRGPELGARLRDQRTGRGLSLREIERRFQINSGYLSQLERGDVAQPTPSMLARLAEAYDIPVSTLMEWAGFQTASPALTPAQAKALSYLGSDPSDDEVEAINAVLKVLRGRAGFSAPHHLDLPLQPAEVELIRQHALALIREAGAEGVFPTPLDDLMAVAKLVYAGEISLTLEEKRTLRRVLGGALDRVLDSLRGMLSFGSREIWLAEDLHPLQRRFVHAHEIGHHILPFHRQIAYLDNLETMHRDLRNACEREANQASIEILAQGDRLRAMGDDSTFGRELIEQLSARTGISLQATARRLSEESKRLVCTVILYRGGATGRLMDPHIYASASFEERFRWSAGRVPTEPLKVTLREAAVAYDSRGLMTTDIKERAVSLRCEAISTPRALIGLVAKDSQNPFARTFTMRH
ncbi:MAG: XRE family transcriptional regulator [Actinomycetota bacterium]|nr:XRE family transcriptional regulator [Actinomycetota bacterium]